MQVRPNGNTAKCMTNSRIDGDSDVEALVCYKYFNVELHKAVNAIDVKKCSRKNKKR